MPLKEEFIELLKLPTEEITQTINKEFLQANNAEEILRFVGDPFKSFAKLDRTYDDESDYQEVFIDFSNGDPKVFNELYKKASDVFKHVFAFLDSNKKREVISGDEYELFYSAAASGSYPQVSFLVEEAKKLDQETEQEKEQEILQPMISARNYYSFRKGINDTYRSGSDITKLILDSVSKENLIPMITSTGDGGEDEDEDEFEFDDNKNKTTLLLAVENNNEYLVEYILTHAALNDCENNKDQLRKMITSTLTDTNLHYPSDESDKVFAMVLEKASDLGICVQQFLFEHKDLLLNKIKRPSFAKAFEKYASEETLKATVSSFLGSQESKERFFNQAIRRNKELESVVNSLILSPQIQPNLDYLSRNVGLVKINYGEHRRLAKSSRYLLAVVLDLKNDLNIQKFANKAFSALVQELEIQIPEEEIIPINYSVNIRSEYITSSVKRLLDLYTKNPRLLLENDLNQTTIDRLQELRNKLIENFSQKYSNLGSQSDLTAEEKAKLAKEKAKEKANLTIKGLLENDVFLGLSDKFTEGVFKKFSSYASEITLKGLDGSEREVALEGIAEFFEKRSRDVILKRREINQDNSSNNSNKDSVVEDAEPETESVASKEANVTSEVSANEESNKNSNEDSNEDSVVEDAEPETESVASKEANVTSEVSANEESNKNSNEDSNEDSVVEDAEPETESVASKEANFTSEVSANEKSKPSSQIGNSRISNLKRSKQSQDNSSNKKPRIRLGS